MSLLNNNNKYTNKSFILCEKTDQWIVKTSWSANKNIKNNSQKWLI